MSLSARIIASVALIVMVVGCSSPQKGVEERLYTSRTCASADDIHPDDEKEAMSLVTYTVGAAILNVAVDALLAKWKENAAGGELEPVVASTNLYQSLASVPRCLLLVRGEFTKQDAADHKPEILIDRLINDHHDVNGTAEQRKRYLAQYHVDPLAAVSHVIEIAIMTPIKPHDPKTMRFAPVFVWIGKSVNGDLSGKRTAGLTVTMSPTDADPVTAFVPLKDLAVGQVYRQAGQPVDVHVDEVADKVKLSSDCNKPQSTEKNPACKYSSVYTLEFPEESPVASNFFANERFSKGSLTAYNLSVTFTEVKPANAVSGFFANVAEKTKPAGMSWFQEKYEPPKAD